MMVRAYSLDLRERVVATVMPDRIIADLDAVPGQLHHQRPQREVRNLNNAGQDPVPFGGKGKGPLAAHRLGRSTPRRPEPPRPLHHARWAGAQLFSDGADALAGLSARTDRSRKSME